MADELVHPLVYASFETRGYWEGAGRGELVLQRCRSCSTVQSKPRNVCATCLSNDIEHFVASGRGTIYTFTVTEQNMAPPFNAHLPYVMAYVALDEGPRLLTHIVGCDPADVRIGQAVVADFQQQDRTDGEAFAVPRFRPA
ncbi:MAG: Zn-ribbon domain-containing OB-fold protein [Acidimicrobiia bacterium]|nr:Zn-ribbon domain-containing OB-fold protein [Acidimicrobiia bacterium]